MVIGAPGRGWWQGLQQSPESGPSVLRWAVADDGAIHYIYRTSYGGPFLTQRPGADGAGPVTELSAPMSEVSIEPVSLFRQERGHGAVLALTAHDFKLSWPYSDRPAVSRFDPAAGWQPVELLPSQPATIQGVTGAVLDDGTMVMNWAVETDGAALDAMYVYRPGSGWSGPFLRPLDGETKSMTAGPGGNVYLMRTACRSGVCDLWFDRYNVDGGWGERTTVASYSLSLSQYAQAGGLHVSPQGDVLVFWSAMRFDWTVFLVAETPWSRVFRVGRPVGDAQPFPATRLEYSAESPDYAVAFLPDGRIRLASRAGVHDWRGADGWSKVTDVPSAATQFAVNPTVGLVTALWVEGLPAGAQFRLAVFE